MIPVLVALGSNLGDRASNIRLALELLPVDGFSIRKVSWLYETAPMYVLDQPPFLNAALIAETEMTPREVLGLLKATERRIGRQAADRNQRREIDLDLIAYGAARYAFGQDLIVPHPKVAERRFVLQPLFDIAPDYVLPGIGIVRDLLAKTDSQADSVKQYDHAAVSLPGDR